MIIVKLLDQFSLKVAVTKFANMFFKYECSLSEVCLLYFWRALQFNKANIFFFLISPLQ